MKAFSSNPGIGTVGRLFIFFSYGFIELLLHDITITGAQDILANTEIPSSSLSTMINFTFVLGTIFCWLFGNRLAIGWKLCAGCGFFLSGSVAVAVLPNAKLKVASVGFLGLGCGFVENAVISLSARYPDDVVHAYSSGGGVGRIVAPLGYTVLTTYICVSPQLIFLLAAVTAFLYPLYYYVLISGACVGNNDYHLISDCEEIKALGTKEYKDISKIPYSELQQGNKPVKARSQNAHDYNDGNLNLSLKAKLLLIYNFFPSMYAIFLCWAVQTIVLQSLLTSLVFPNAPFKPRDHFQYYAMSVWMGEFLGRSYGFFIKPCGGLKGRIPSVNTRAHIYTCLILLEVTFFVFAAWYRFLPSVWLTLMISATEGIITGAAYLNSFSVSKEDGSSHKETDVAFIRATMIIIHGMGGGIGALAGTFLEPIIRQHCLNNVVDSEYCFTRYTGRLGSSKPCFNNLF